MQRLFNTILILASFVILAGCASDGSFSNPFSSDPPPSTPYYFAGFPDVPIPHDVSEVTSESVITYGDGGVKGGVQRFKGRVEANSLVSAMRDNMLSQGWEAKSMLRAQESVLVFEKADRICTIYVSDDTIYTNMRIFVSPRIAVSGAKYTPVAANSNTGTNSQTLNQ